LFVRPINPSVPAIAADLWKAFPRRSRRKEWLGTHGDLFIPGIMVYTLATGRPPAPGYRRCDKVKLFFRESSCDAIEPIEGARRA